MSVDLLKIPGVEPKGRRRRMRSWRPHRRLPSVTGRRRGMPWVTLGLWAVYVALGLYLANAFWQGTRIRVGTEGLRAGEVVTSRELAGREVALTVDPDRRLDRAELRLDGRELDAKAVEQRDGVIRWRPGRLAEGHHVLTLTVPRPILSESKFRWGFWVDDGPPPLELPTLLANTPVCAPVTIAGRTEPGAVVTVDGKPVPTDRGAFTLSYDRPPTAPLHVVATDPAGNRTEREVIVPVRYPGGQGVHVTAVAWSYEPLRNGILALIDAGLISVVQLDLKDEGGVVGYDSKVPLARQVGAVEPSYRLAETVAQLKRRGVRVIGRVVAFRDERLTRWAWANDRRDWVVQTPGGGIFSSYAEFTNLAHPEVQRYNLDLAVEAVEAGVDDILWDYIRRPEGALSSMVFPGMQGTPADAVVGFLQKSHTALRSRCTVQGVAVFGVAADDPDAVGQDVPRMARNADYVAPMLYPSHWVPGMYGVRNPNQQPGDIVHASLAHFQAQLKGTGKPLVPWLQDFSLGHPYGPAEVRAQIDAARRLGVEDWLLWNAGVVYTSGALDRSLVTRPVP